mgnify:CR=1 FL=1
MWPVLQLYTTVLGRPANSQAFWLKLKQLSLNKCLQSSLEIAYHFCPICDQVYIRYHGGENCPHFQSQAIALPWVWQAWCCADLVLLGSGLPSHPPCWDIALYKSSNIGIQMFEVWAAGVCKHVYLPKSSMILELGTVEVLANPSSPWSED